MPEQIGKRTKKDKKGQKRIRKPPRLKPPCLAALENWATCPLEHQNSNGRSLEIAAPWWDARLTPPFSEDTLQDTSA